MNHSQGYQTQRHTKDSALHRGYQTQQSEHNYNQPLESGAWSHRQQPEGIDGPPVYYGSQQRPYMPLQQEYNIPATGLQGNIPAAISYLCFWLTGLLFLLFEHKNSLVRFHAMQSLLFFGGVTILYIVLINMMEMPIIGGFAIFAFVVMNVIAVVAWFVGMIGAISGKYTKLPFVGEIAERFVNGDVILK
ncbi:MAG TPA: hypothetical protein VKR06_16465 [Ktedonosporobacter sp.]|nr:hypothetical protein [Ktedonosporobacter sp.]